MKDKYNIYAKKSEVSNSQLKYLHSNMQFYKQRSNNIDLKKEELLK